MNTTPLARLPLLIGLIAALSITLAACSSSAAPSAPPNAEPPASSPAATDQDTSVGASADPGAGGGDGGPAIVVPKPGTINPHPVSVEKIEPSIDGRHVTVKLTWTSGVEPCYVLDSVVTSRDGDDIVLTVVEGAGEEGAICIEIAMQKATIVDLGEMEPGDYTIVVTDSDIPPVSITVV